jgi:hypothetical protein
MLATFVIAVQLVGCSPRGDNVPTAEKLEQANQKIAALESELAGLRARKPATGVSTPAPTPAPSPSSPSAPTEPEPKPAAVEPTGQQWHYNVSEEKMTGGLRRTAGVESTNTVEFGFPYSGAQNGRLILRTESRDKDVMFRIEKGQILCTSYDGCTVQVRFDDDKPTSFSATTAADHSSDVVFLNDYNRFLAKMRKAKRVRISLDVYQNGRPVFDFDVSGFDFNKFQAKS